MTAIARKSIWSVDDFKFTFPMQHRLFEIERLYVAGVVDSDEEPHAVFGRAKDGNLFAVQMVSWESSPSFYLFIFTATGWQMNRLVDELHSFFSDNPYFVAAIRELEIMVGLCSRG